MATPTELKERQQQERKLNCSRGVFATARLEVGKKKKSSRNNKHASAQPNKAKQVQQLQKQQQQQQQDSSSAAGPKAARTKKGASKSSPRVLASSPVNGGGAAIGSAPTESGSPAPPWELKRHLPTRGLVNVGNTCFFNSTLQNVFKARLLHQSLFGEDSGRRGGEYVGPVTKAFRKVLLEMKGEGPVGGRRGAYNPKALLTAVQRAHPSFRGYHQHDAHELFMRLVGTLEDEEDLCIKKRREEGREGDDSEEEQKKQETDAVNDEEGEKDEGEKDEGEKDEGPAGQPEDGSGSGEADADADGGPRSGTDSEDPSNDEVGAGDVLASNAADMSVGGACGGVGGGKATQGTQEKSAAASAGLLKGAKEAASPGVPPVLEANSAKESIGLFRGNASAAVTGIACAEKSDGDARTPATGDEMSEAAEASPASKDKHAASSKTNQAPSERVQGSDSAPAYDKDGTKDTTACGCRDADADAETTTDDGETTDAGDLEDDDDNNSNNIENDSSGAKGTGALSPRREPAGLSAEAAEANVPAGGGDTAGKEDEAGYQGAEHTAATALRVSAGPQCAAVTEVFGGRLCSVVTCGSCGGRSFCTEPTVCLSLEIPFKAKAPSEKGLAYIAKKKAAAAAAAAAAKVESVPTESAASGLKPWSGAADDEVDEMSEPDPPKAEGTTSESDGFVLSVSVKQKKKAARQERVRQRLINAQKNAGGHHGADNTSALMEESPGDKNVDASTEEGGLGHRAPQDGRDEVRQCLEHVLSVCVSAAAGAVGGGGANGDATTAPEVDSEVTAAKHTADKSDIADSGKDEEAEEAEGASDDILAGFRLSTKERKKIARQEKNERQRTMEAKAEVFAGKNEKITFHSPTDEVDESGGEGGKKIGMADAVPVGSELETANQSRAPCANGDSDPATKLLTGGPEKQSEAAAAQADGRCGARSGKRGDSDTLAKGHAAQSAESSHSVDEQRPSAHCDARSCGFGPVSGDDSTAVETSGKSERGEETEGVPGDASGRREQQPPDVELRNSNEVTSDEGAFSSSGSLTGCTTGETQGSTGHGGDGGSAFGSECSEGSGGGKGSDQDCVEDAGLADSRLKRPETSDESQIEGETKPPKNSPEVDPASAPTGLDTCAVATEGTDIIADEEKESQPQDGGSIANDSGRDARRDGTDPDEGSGTKQADSTNCVPPAPTGAATAAAVPQSPLDRLQAPPPRAKPDRRHDPVGLDLYECLDHFVAEEALVAKDGNGYDCESCNSRSRSAAAAAAAAAATVESDDADSDDDQAKGEGSAPRSQQDARKRLLMLGRPPGMLVCHLKRLQAKKKVIRSVEFPIELDMSPYFWRDPDAPLTSEQTRYRLTGLIQHRGRRDSGHFVAYVRDGDEWKHASDSAIRTASLPEVKACEAYMLFYERFSETDTVTAAIEESKGSGVDDAAAVSDAPAVSSTKEGLDPEVSGKEALTLEAETTTAAEVTEERKAEEEEKGQEEKKGAKHASAEEGQEGEAGGKTCAAQGSAERAAAASDAGDIVIATGIEATEPAKSAADEEGVEENVETANEIEEKRGVLRTLV